MGVLLISGDMGTVDEIVPLLGALNPAAVHVAASVAEAQAVIRTHPLRLVVADVRTGLSPDAVVGTLRGLSPVPVVMLGGDDPEQAAPCLDSGADDWMCWPGSPAELLARMRRRIRPEGSGPQAGDRQSGSPAVPVDGDAVDLTAREFELLRFLAASPGTVFSVDELLEAVWHSSRRWQAASTVREHIYRLRQKIEADPSAPTCIVTVRGRGYRFEAQAVAISSR